MSVNIESNNCIRMYLYDKIPFRSEVFSWSDAFADVHLCEHLQALYSLGLE